MSTHGILNQVDDHVTYCNIDGEWKTFNYVELMSLHNCSKHWVDDINNRCHDPISLEDVWTTKWWPTRQFTFICSVTEVNAVNLRDQGKKETADPQLTFCRNLAMDMLENEIGVFQQPHHSPVKTRNARKVPGHEKKKLLLHTSAWAFAAGTWRQTNTLYLCLNCAVCKNLTCLYCKCNPAVPLCHGCYHLSWPWKGSFHWSTGALN